MCFSCEYFFASVGPGPITEALTKQQQQHEQQMHGGGSDVSSSSPNLIQTAATAARTSHLNQQSNNHLSPSSNNLAPPLPPVSTSPTTVAASAAAATTQLQQPQGKKFKSKSSFSPERTSAGRTAVNDSSNAEGRETLSRREGFSATSDEHKRNSHGRQNETVLNHKGICHPHPQVAINLIFKYII